MDDTIMSIEEEALTLQRYSHNQKVRDHAAEMLYSLECLLNHHLVSQCEVCKNMDSPAVDRAKRLINKILEQEKYKTF